MKKILLGSKSPRRRELLAGLDIPFEIVDIQCEETFPENLKEGNIPLHIARLKAAAYKNNLREDELLITADTIVWADGIVLGKPHNEEDAKKMLHFLSDKTHQVYTAVCLTSTDKSIDFIDKTDVVFSHLTDEQIDYYIKHYRPLDKAGAYGVQEWIGYIGVKAINGSFYNVMGLPVHRLYESLMLF